jgi:hypothetical protein
MTTATASATQAQARTKTRFQSRVAVSLFLVTSFLFFVLSGVVLYLAPSGRVAESSFWKFLWLDKGQWEAMHTSVSFIWVPIALLHVVYNWRPIVGYMRSRGKRMFRSVRELTLATLATLFIAAASVGDWAPVKQMMDLGESMDAFWTDRANANGYYIPVGEEELPAGFGEAPAATEPVLSAGEQPANAVEVRKGFGRFTVKEIAERYEIPFEIAVARLGAKGVRDVKADENLLAISGRTGFSPSDLDAIVQDKPLVSTEEGAASKEAGK